MARTSTGLPKRFPPGTVYVVESRGSVQGMTLMRRYVRLPDGRKVELVARFVQPCGRPAAELPKAAATSARRSRARPKVGVPAAVG